jgi:hypothetical protein
MDGIDLGVAPRITRLDGIEAACDAARTLTAVRQVSAHLCHSLSVAIQNAPKRGEPDWVFWRDAFRLLHARRDALLHELADGAETPEAEAAVGATDQPATWP